MTYEDGTNSVFQNVGTENTDADKSPKTKNTTFTTQGMSEIKNNSPLWGGKCTKHSIIQRTPDQEIQNEEEYIVDSQFHNHENNEGLNYKNSSVSRMV
jgi:hypothetical protein